jgi:hypothetical protein
LIRKLKKENSKGLKPKGNSGSSRKLKENKEKLKKLKERGLKQNRDARLT